MRTFIGHPTNRTTVFQLALMYALSGDSRNVRVTTSPFVPSEGCIYCYDDTQMHREPVDEQLFAKLWGESDPNDPTVAGAGTLEVRETLGPGSWTARLRSRRSAGDGDGGGDGGVRPVGSAIPVERKQ